jgi:hypothetical protein
VPLLSLMPRNPFVWEVQVRREVLDAEMARLREVPYSHWHDVVRTPISKVVNGRDNRPYRARVSAEVVPDGSGDIRVTVSLARASLFRRQSIRQSFVVSANDTHKV